MYGYMSAFFSLSFLIYRDVIVARFVDLERELRMLNERAADARRSSLRQLLVVPQLAGDRRRRTDPVARQQAESLPLRLAVKLHAQMVRCRLIQTHSHIC